jgi:fatty-acyl-CoA synthase
MSDTVQARFLRVVKKHPERPCIIHGDRVYSFRETNQRVNSVANAFLDMGVRKGDKVAAGLYNCPQLVETWLAAFKIGAVGVNINYRLTADEIEYVLKDSETRVLVLDEDLLDGVQRIWPRLPGLERCVVVGKKVPESMLGYEALLRKYPGAEPRFNWEIRSGDLAQLFYTGGTTGMPKGVMHTHESNLAVTDNLGVNGIFMGIFRSISSAEGYKEVIDAWLGVLVGLAPHIPDRTISALSRLVKAERTRRVLASSRTQDAIRKLLFLAWRRPPAIPSILPLKHLVASPIIHGTAWWGGALLCLDTGFTLVLPTSKHFDPAEALGLIEKHGVNVLLLVGDKFSKMILGVPEIDSYDCTSLAMIASSGAHWTGEVKAELHRHYPNALIIDVLGSTESPIVSTGVYFKGDEYGALGPGDVEVRVVDEGGREVSPGVVGAIIVKADSSGLGYYHDEEKSRQTWIEEGWLSTGDSGTRDEDGNIIVFGRGSEVITSGGVKIWAEEVETVVGQFPKVRDVVVFGVPDPEWGESVMAAVVLNEAEVSTEEEIIEFVKDRIASFKKPRYVSFVEELPEQPFGKIRRGLVKDMFRGYLAERGAHDVRPA